MNEWNLYSALKSLQMYAKSTALSRELKLKQTDEQEKTVRSGVRKIGKVSSRKL